MGKRWRPILILAVAIGLYEAVAFWHAYHQSKSLAGGISLVVFSLIGWAFYGWLISGRPNSR
jgi:hypothetical protein